MTQLPGRDPLMAPRRANPVSALPAFSRGISLSLDSAYTNVRERDTVGQLPDAAGICRTMANLQLAATEQRLRAT